MVNNCRVVLKVKSSSGPILELWITIEDCKYDWTQDTYPPNKHKMLAMLAIIFKTLWKINIWQLG